VTRWNALGAQRLYGGGRPQVGDLVPMEHAVWRVVSVHDEPVLADDDLAAWQREGMPDLDTWRGRPYTVAAVHVGGVTPQHEALRNGKPGIMRIHPRTSGRGFSWQTYPNGRWAKCSCCGEPMPCRAELTDRTVDAAEERVVAFERRLPGCCWSCEEPITSRQRTVAYPGTNLDLPTAPAPRFHTRLRCLDAAEAYEARWLKDDPRRARVLTWPACKGTLVVHHDGSTECHGGRDDCWGHDDSDHGNRTACIFQSHGCGRGCTSEGHPGCRPRPRAPRGSEQLT